jgi:carbamoyltransferase
VAPLGRMGRGMYVIGISSGLKHGHHDGGAVLMRDGELIAASEEERFTLAKHARGELPRGAIRFCLKQAGITMRDVDYICSPLKSYPYYQQRLADYFEFHFGYAPPVDLYDHHLCHAASTYLGSGFSEATVICVDNSGDSSSGGIFHGVGRDIREIKRFERHNSLGLYYGMMTQYLGYQMTNDEYKVMGLASYGEPAFLDRFDEILRPDGIGFEFDRLLDRRLCDGKIYTTDFSTRQERIFTERLEELLGPRRLPGAPLDERMRNIAASAQRKLEHVLCEMVHAAIERTGCADLALAGGVALNCKANMEILHGPGVGKLYIPPVPHDAGVALGAAMLKCAEQGYQIEPIRHAYFGPEYDGAYIRHMLEQTGAQFEELTEPFDRAVDDLIKQKTVGWFQGRMEFGPRALGNRSILADPRAAEMKDRINATIKYREEFRPFCPSVLIEEQGRYFEDGVEAPFMNLTLPANRDAHCSIPAVVHVDHTARIQSVRKETNPVFHRLIGSFRDAGGVPCLLNTSLNINEQPTVNGPLEAMHTYFCSGLDVLYLGNFRLAKS